MKQFEEKVRSYAEAKEAGNVEASDRIAFNLLAMAAEKQMRNPSPNVTLKVQAADFEQAGDWAAAEKTLHQVLELDTASGNAAAIAKTQMDLSRLLRVTGRHQEARAYADAAVGSARRAGVFPVLAIALDCQIACARVTGDTETSLLAASEMVQVIEPGKMFQALRANALATRAQSCADAGNLAEAESDLALSWELFNAPGVSKRMPGSIAGLGKWWEAQALLLERRGRPEAALEAQQKAVELSRQLDGPYARIALARRLARLAEIFAVVGNTEEAERVRAEVRAIRTELRLPDDAK